MAESVTDAVPIEPLSDEVLAAMLGEAAPAGMLDDPYAAGLRLAVDAAVAAALPAVLGALAVLEPATRPVLGVAPVAVAPAAAVPRGATEAPASAVTPVAAVLPVELVAAAERAAAGPVANTAVAPVSVREPDAVAMAGGAAAPVMAEAPVAAPRAAEAGRLDWGGLEWGRLAALPGVMPEAVPSVVGVAPADPVSAPAAAMAEAAGWVGLGGQSAAPVEAGVPRAAVAAAAEAGWPGVAEMVPGERDDGGEPVIEGRLDIDGTLLGRFVAEYLGREAGRPQGGMTGFDPLVSPVWAGALQG